MTIPHASDPPHRVTFTPELLGARLAILAAALKRRGIDASDPDLAVLACDGCDAATSVLGGRVPVGWTLVIGGPARDLCPACSRDVSAVGDPKRATSTTGGRLPA